MSYYIIGQGEWQMPLKEFSEWSLGDWDLFLDIEKLEEQDYFDDGYIPIYDNDGKLMLRFRPTNLWQYQYDLHDARQHLSEAIDGSSEYESEDDNNIDFLIAEVEDAEQDFEINIRDALDILQFELECIEDGEKPAGEDFELC